jgi:hypothetical protein
MCVNRDTISENLRLFHAEIKGGMGCVCGGGVTTFISSEELKPRMKWQATRQKKFMK